MEHATDITDSITQKPKRGRPKKNISEKSIQSTENLESGLNIPKRGRPKKIISEKSSDDSSETIQKRPVKIKDQIKRPVGRPIVSIHLTAKEKYIKYKDVNVAAGKDYSERTRKSFRLLKDMIKNNIINDINYITMAENLINKKNKSLSNQI